MHSQWISTFSFCVHGNQRSLISLYLLNVYRFIQCLQQICTVQSRSKINVIQHILWKHKVLFHILLEYALFHSVYCVKAQILITVHEFSEGAQIIRDCLFSTAFCSLLRNTTSTKRYECVQRDPRPQRNKHWTYSSLEIYVSMDYDCSRRCQN
jgi:hypothetical protein